MVKNFKEEMEVNFKENEKYLTLFIKEEAKEMRNMIDSREVENTEKL